MASADDLATARIKFMREPAGTVNNPQAVSDLIVKKAGEILLTVRPVLVQHNQKVVLGRVNAAIKQITLALKAN